MQHDNRLALFNFPLKATVAHIWGVQSAAIDCSGIIRWKTFTVFFRNDKNATAHIYAAGTSEWFEWPAADGDDAHEPGSDAALQRQAGGGGAELPGGAAAQTGRRRHADEPEETTQPDAHAPRPVAAGPGVPQAASSSSPTAVPSLRKKYLSSTGFLTLIYVWRKYIFGWFLQQILM